MPFRKRQNMPVPQSFASVLPEVVSMENGEVMMQYKDESRYSLPDIETTRLRDLLEAGVDLKQVNTKLFNAKELTTHITDETAVQEPQPSEEGE